MNERTRAKVWRAAVVGGIVLCAGVVSIGCTTSAAPVVPREAKTAATTHVDAPKTRVKLPEVKDRLELPGFDGATGWVNVEHPPTKADLDGRVVLVDFWTSCCINCLQTLPALAAMERRFDGKPFTVIGVHAPKFDGESSPLRLENVVRELGIRHAVAVDSNMAIWRSWGVRAWPTLLVLDARGRAVWADTGEPDTDELAAVIESALADGASRGELASGPATFVKPGAPSPGVLSFPTEVASLGAGRVAVADTGHDRVVVLGKNGVIEQVAGSGDAGFQDGDLAHASFRSPHGIAARGDVVYVADTGNHAIRAIDLAKETVSTVAGTGVIGEHPLAPGDAPAREVALRSPWDVLFMGDQLVVALAGSHQLATFDPAKGTLAWLAGSGRENIVDGGFVQAAFAQPSALATDGKLLYVADSETSSVRAVDLAAHRVTTVVGTGLFDFGDVDGDKARARFQHPLGLAFLNGSLFVSDTYNEKLRRVDPKTGETSTVVTQEPLHQPTGIVVVDGRLLIADSHADGLLRVDPKSGDAQVLVAIDRAPRVAIDPRDPVENGGHADVPASGRAIATLGLSTPPGTHLNLEAPVKLSWVVLDGVVVGERAIKLPGKDAKRGVPFEIGMAEGAKDGSLKGVLEAVLCDDAKTVCTPVRRTVSLVAEAKDPKSPAFAANQPGPAWGVQLPAAK